jgi:hypothetical protein
VPRKATNLALVVYDEALRVMVLLETQKQPSSCDSWSLMSTQVRSCWFRIKPQIPGWLVQAQPPAHRGI